MAPLPFISPSGLGSRKRSLQNRARPWLEALEDRCLPAGNPIVSENLLPGNLQSEWDIVGAGDMSIQGYSTQISVDHGETVYFKIDTPAKKYHLDIYRMGYYGGMGARKVATVQVNLAAPQVQPNPLTDSTTGLLDAGNWSVSASWNVPAAALSGIYFAKVTRDDVAGASSHIVFIVRDDERHSDLLFQTSDTTWQAYNSYGGGDVYGPVDIDDRSYAVSYNRPIIDRSVQGAWDSRIRFSGVSTQWSAGSSPMDTTLVISQMWIRHAVAQKSSNTRPFSLSGTTSTGPLKCGTT